MIISDFVVVVPAHNERQLLAASVAGIAAAALQVSVPVTIMVVFDACSDGSQDVVGPGVGRLEVNVRSVGGARAAGFAAAPDPGHHTWFATTDADSVVPEDWLAQQTMSANAGAEVFVGTVTPTHWKRWPAEARAKFELSYSRVDNHRHIHGANLGMSAAAYASVGGFRDLTQDEDVDIVTRLQAANAVITWSGQATVSTSTRRIARAPKGFAAAISGIVDQKQDSC